MAGGPGNDQAFRIAFENADDIGVTKSPAAREKTFTVPKSAEHASIPCLYLLLALLVILLLFVCKSKQGKMPHARYMKAPKEHDKLLLLDPDVADRAFASQLKNLTPCYDNACKDYRTLAIEVKDVHANSIKQFIVQTPRFT